jgi:hypothetical protein
MNPGYILIACGLVGLAIAFNLRSRGPGGAQRAAMAFRLWVTRGLYRGDLSALAYARRGNTYDIDLDQIGRLRQRGFLRKGLFGGVRLTFKGRLALVVRSVVIGGQTRSGRPWNRSS